jgi:hypothetical protein
VPHIGATFTFVDLSWVMGAIIGATFTIAPLLPFKGAQVAVKGLAL